MTEAGAPGRTRRRLLALPGVLAAAAMLGWSVLHGVPLMTSDLASQGARQKVDAWARKGQGWTVEEWQQARSDLLGALATAPGDPVLHVTLAQLYVTQGLVAWADDEQRQAYFAEALEHQQRALQLRPTDGFTWAQVALSSFALGQPVESLHVAWGQALRWAPREASIQRTLLDITLAQWDQVPADMRAWALQTWREATPAQQRYYSQDAQKWGRDQVFQ
jgi:tetratricopeptide (TPR) repeat protein